MSRQEPRKEEPAVALAPVPSLDEVAQQPKLVLDLPQSAVEEVMFKAMKVQEACFMALLASGRPAPAVPEHDKLLTAKEAAEMLRISPLTLLRKRDRSPYREFVVAAGTRSPRFSWRRMQEYIVLPHWVRYPRAIGSGVAAQAAVQPPRRLDLRDRSGDERHAQAERGWQRSIRDTLKRSCEASMTSRRQ